MKQSKRRGRGEGAIFRRKDGRWAASVNLGWKAGKRWRKSFYGATRKEVADALAKALRDRQQGLPLANEKQTVSAFLAHWLEHTVKPSVRPRTHQSYELLARLHVLPELGNKPLAQLAPEHVESLLARKLASGLAAQTVRHIRTVLKKALGQAVKRGHLARNVAAMVDPPRLQRRQQGQVLDAEQTRMLLAAAESGRLWALLVIAVSLGLRRGEILGLRWLDLDLDKSRIAIGQAIQRYSGIGLKAAEPKTGRSRRVLNLPQACARALRAWRARQAEERLAAGPEWRDSGLVFTTPFGTPIDPRNLHRQFKALLMAAGLPQAVRFHDLRHGCASYLLSQGVPLKTISDLLGHSSITVTSDIYAHIAPQMLQEAAAKMDALLDG